MACIITGLGTSVPAAMMQQSWSCEFTSPLCCESDEQRRVMQLIYEGAGVQQRGSVLVTHQRVEHANDDFFQLRKDDADRGPSTQQRMEKYEEHALALAIQSSQAALAQADQDPASITHLVTVSCSGFAAPGFDIGLIKELGLSPDTSRTHVGFMGCHGSFNGLRVAKGYADADPDAVVLLCSVELCSLHHFYGWSTEKVIANALFADGSGAAVVRSAAADRIPAHAKYQLVRNGSHLMAKTTNAMSWRIGDYGFEMTLSQKVPSLIEENLLGWLTPFLARDGLTVSDIRGWAIHPGGPRILDACLAALSLSSDDLIASRETLANYGNMSSATILFVLDRMKQLEIDGPVVALGFGPGLTIEAMLLRSDG